MPQTNFFLGVPNALKRSKTRSKSSRRWKIVGPTLSFKNTLCIIRYQYKGLCFQWNCVDIGIHQTSLSIFASPYIVSHSIINGPFTIEWKENGSRQINKCGLNGFPTSNNLLPDLSKFESFQTLSDDSNGFSPKNLTKIPIIGVGEHYVIKYSEN